MRCSLIFRSVATATLAVCACTAPGANVPREDKVFASALQRYQRTRVLVDKDVAAVAEAPMFMIAEGLYRYQLQFPPRGFGVYAAQAAAVALELPEPSFSPTSGNKVCSRRGILRRLEVGSSTPV